MAVLVIFYLFIYSIRSEAGHEGTFARSDFRFLKASPIEQKKVGSDMECGFPCARDKECRSFNVAAEPDVGDGLRVCQLLDTDAEMAPELLVESLKFHHFNRLRTPCEKVQCQNGGTCVETDSLGTGYRCDCTEGFMGVNCEKVKWIKFNTLPVRFGAKDDQYGSFSITLDGFIFTIKLVWLQGYVTVTKSVPRTRSHWYCNDEFTGAPLSKLGIIITDASKTRVLPLNKDINLSTNLYQIPGYDSMSPELVFKNFTTPYKVTIGQQFQIWFFQDLMNYYEETNEGTVDVDVYGLYI